MKHDVLTKLLNIVVDTSHQRDLNVQFEVIVPESWTQTGEKVERKKLTNLNIIAFDLGLFHLVVMGLVEQQQQQKLLTLTALSEYLILWRFKLLNPGTLICV